MAIGSNQAHSSKIFFVEKEISVSAPPMMPPMPTAREPSPSEITQMPCSSVRSMPSRVRIFSLGMAELEHDVVGGVDDVVDAGYAGGFEAVFEPLRRRLNFCATNDTRGEAAAKFGRLDFDAGGVGGLCAGDFFRLRRDWFQGNVENGADFAGDAVVAEAIGPIGRNFRVHYGAVRTIFDAADVRAGERQARGEFVGSGFHVDEIFEPVVDDFHTLACNWP